MKKPPFLDLELCLRSGQYFHWKSLDTGWGLVNGEDFWFIEERGNQWKIHGEEKTLKEFFQWNRDYQQIFSKLEEEEELRPLLKNSEGLRILRQNPWDATLAFLLSTNNNMKRIQNSIYRLGEQYGEKLETVQGETFYSLPKPERVKEISPEEFRKTIGAGYRDKYLVRSAEQIAKGEVDFYRIHSMEYPRALEEIQKLFGVGKKAADCILLFGFGKEDSFPVDVWMERAVEELYGSFPNRESMAQFGQNKFQENAGLVQQILFQNKTFLR